MPTPAERKADADARNAFARSPVGAFAATLDFPLDDFQVAGCEAVAAGRGVLVAAPTGAGKTVVGEFAVHEALRLRRKAFYTTPIKALSNQKYHDLARRHGYDKVGLLTGDTSVNGEAPVVVMTTEVLRNMLYAGSHTLTDLGYVVMDEVHYLADRFRGAVWEEVIIHLPQDVQVVSLSATVSNAEEFGEWLGTVRGKTDIVVSEHRPVPLWQHVLVGHESHDLFAEGVTPARLARGSINPDLERAIRNAQERGRAERVDRALGGRGARGARGRVDRGGHGSGHGQRGDDRDRGRGDGRPAGRPGGGATRAEVITGLDRDALLPAIVFIFSRIGCSSAVGQLLSADVRLVTDRQGERNRRLVEERVASLGDGDLSVLGYWDFVDGISRGYAAHHAGMLPLFREVVEELFVTGAIRAVFATETLALGINMPARTVVLEKLVKFNGEAHVDITPAEYTQLTGRAGRRGIDVEGHALVQWQRGMDPEQVAGLASTRTYPLRSSFRPTYNMAVNLVAQVGRDTAREILETSFAQFQADRSVVGIATTARANDEALTGYREAMECHLGDFEAYAAIRHQLGRLEKDAAKQRSASLRAEAAVSLGALRLGDVIRIPSGRRAGWAVVVVPDQGHVGSSPAPSVVTEDKQLRRLTLSDVDRPVQAVTQVRLPKHFNPKSPKSRRDIATTLRIAVPHGDAHLPKTTPADADDAAQVADLRRRLVAHPCHQCPDRETHARWAERWWRLKRENAGLQRRMQGRTNSVARTFERICDVLAQLGYLGEDGTSVTPLGQTLRSLYTERDLLAAECLRTGTWKRLDAPALAAVVSTLVHEPRGGEADPSPRMPTEAVGEAVQEMQRIWDGLESLEHDAGLTSPGMPDGGLAWAMHRWASGRALEEVLRGQDMAAGDFVRRCKQVVDLLGQIAEAAPEPEVRRTARQALDGVLRGVVALDRLD